MNKLCALLVVATITIFFSGCQSTDDGRITTTADAGTTTTASVTTTRNTISTSIAAVDENYTTTLATPTTKQKTTTTTKIRETVTTTVKPISTTTSKRTTTATTTLSTTIPVSSIKFDASSICLVAGKHCKPEIAIEPQMATDKAVMWASSNPAVATVDSGGTIVGVAEGTATVTATVNNVKQSILVNVRSEDSVDFDRDPITLKRKGYKIVISDLNHYILVKEKAYIIVEVTVEKIYDEHGNDYSRHIQTDWNMMVDYDDASILHDGQLDFGLSDDVSILHHGQLDFGSFRVGEKRRIQLTEDLISSAYSQLSFSFYEGFGGDAQDWENWEVVKE